MHRTFGLSPKTMRLKIFCTRVVFNNSTGFCYCHSKSYLNLDLIIRAFKNGNLQWFKSIIACLSIALLALYLISSKNDYKNLI